jgi:NADPH:quinone reductase-like Zn-dependent oxidoreductase
LLKAIVQDRYGPPADVLRLEDVDEPTMKDDEVLVRVRAASLHPDVWHMATGRPYVLRIMGAGFRRPRIRIPGTDIAGRVERIGKGVTGFQPGDDVFGESLRGHQWHNGGAYAELVSTPQGSLAHKPSNVTFEQAAAVPTSGFIALLGVRDLGGVKPGQHVLINGAGGGVGTFSVQLAKAFGATVTAVDTAKKLDLLRSIGADHVIDHRKEDFTASGERYDVIIDVPANHPPSVVRRALTPKGTYVLIGHEQFGRSAGRWIGGIGRFIKLLSYSPFVSQNMAPFRAGPKDHLAVFRALIEAGTVRPIVDRTYPLARITDAIRYLETGDVLGKIVIKV